MNSKKDKIILIGGGGHCKSVIDVIESENKFQILGILDDDESKIGTYILGYKILGTGEDLAKFKNQTDFAIVTIGQVKNPEPRIRYFKLAQDLGFFLPKIVSPFAIVSRHAKIGNGTVVMHGAIVNASAKVGENSILNSKSLVEHDAIVENSCHISTGAILNGGVLVGENSFIGSGAVCREYTEIPKQSFIKANSIYKG
ncbi:sugar O-acyltransferase, sialic acid O-acetyltransferase NeuD family [Thiovulum sp. ES]|nr:sugar O-acyltransferase, sialic acid O-acetyltransferase NeuD family [Thiovulum sp. ES]